MNRLNRIVLILTALVALLGTACGAANSNNVSADVRAQWDANRIQHNAKRRAEKARMAAAASPALPMVPGMPVMAPNGVSLPPGVMGVQQGFVPQLPPPNVYQLHRPVPGCSQPNAIEIHNESNYFVQLNVDGVGLRIFGPEGEMGVPQANGALLSVIPPNTRVYGCLQRQGTVHINGTAYNNLGGMLSAVAKFDLQRVFFISTVKARGLQLFRVTEKTIRWNRS